MLPIVSALPEILLLSLLCVILLMDAFLTPRWRIATYYAVQSTLIMIFIMVVFQYRHLTLSSILFDGEYIVDSLALLSKCFILIASFFSFVYAREYIAERNIASSDYYILGLFAVLGMFVMVSAASLLTVYLGLELSSLALYTLVALHKQSSAASESAMKYFVTGAFASGILLYGVSMLYGVTGTLSITGAQLLNAHNTVLLMGLIFLLAGLLFKLGSVPFHMWVPDVYHGAPTSVTLFIASAPKIAALTVIFRIFAVDLLQIHVIWEHAFMVISILSMFLGNVLAIAQTNVKRMLAYSSIAHMGYALLGIIAGPDSVNGYSAAFFYMVTYVMVAAGGFAVVTLLSKGSEFERLEDYRGLNARNPWLAFMMLLLLFSMAGVPPTVGFFAKLGLLEALVEANTVWLAALALVFSIIGAYYYLRLVMLMYFEEPTGVLTPTRVSLTAGMRLAITVNGVAALFLGLFPSGLIDLCRVTFVV